MINKDSIVTAYDEHLTLVEWLQKVEATLKDASAVSFNVNKRGDATLTFSIVFADGSELETGPITLEQGESVQGATIRNGHLILTLTNGDELDAGNLGGVSGFSISDLQHLIVTYQNGTTQDLGAIFNGNVAINGALSTPILTSANDHIEAQKPVVEVMTGYSYIDLESVGYEKTYAYAGCCKNGNKITFAVCLQLKKTSVSTASNFDIGQFNIPTSIGQKLNEVQVGTYSWLDNRVITIFENSSSFVSIPVRASKNGNDKIRLQVADSRPMQEDTMYTLRYEITFLLSDNLA